MFSILVMKKRRKFSYIFFAYYDSLGTSCIILFIYPSHMKLNYFFISKKHYTKLNSFSVYLAFHTFLLIFLSVRLEAGVLLQETSLLHSILKCLLGASSTEFFFQPDSYMVLNI